MHRRRPERAPGNEAQDKRNAPGERDEDLRPAAGKQRVFPQHAQSPLQFEERPAMRGQIFPDPARFVLIGVDADGDIRAPNDASHIPSLRRRQFLAGIAFVKP